MNGLVVKMHRLGIFVFYNKRGRAGRYIDYLLEKTMSILDELIIAVNGRMDEDAERMFRKYTPRIYIRENVGFDAGAHKDVLMELFESKELLQWDELLLFNDTFFGPLDSWDCVISEMEHSNADFWGLSAYYGSYSDGEIEWEKFPYHVQGYFVMLRQPLLSSQDFQEYWREASYARTFREAVITYEVGMSQFFCKRGYKADSFLERVAPKLNEKDVVFFVVEIESLLLDYGFPVIKKKPFFNLLYYERFSRMIEHIRNQTDYDAEMILEQLYQADIEGEVRPLSPSRLRNFVNTHNHVYIYGHGRYGNGIARMMRDEGLRYHGIVVTDRNAEDSSEIEYRDLKMEPEDGLILAVKESFAQEISENIKGAVDDNQIFRFDYWGERC